jgi:hypothetical protein
MVKYNIVEMFSTFYMQEERNGAGSMILAFPLKSMEITKQWGDYPKDNVLAITF